MRSILTSVYSSSIVKRSRCSTVPSLYVKHTIVPCATKNTPVTILFVMMGSSFFSLTEAYHEISYET